MFDIGWTELLVIACVAIIVVGPKDLPRMLRSLGQTIGKVKRMSREFQSTFNDALREAEREADISDMKKQVEEVGNFNPLGDLKKTLEEEKAEGKAKAEAANKAAEEPQPWMPKDDTSADKDSKAAETPAAKTESKPAAKSAAAAKPKTKAAASAKKAPAGGAKKKSASSGGKAAGGATRTAARKSTKAEASREDTKA
jgi:sec-independent protein translocase protein TatB